MPWLGCLEMDLASVEEADGTAERACYFAWFASCCVYCFRLVCEFSCLALHR